MTVTGPRRLMVLAVGSRGLGQTVRALRMVDHVVDRGEAVTATVVTGIPHASQLFASRSAAAVISLPEVSGLIELAMRGADGDALRAATDAATDRLSVLVDTLAPDVFVTTSHRGVTGELLPILRDLRARQCRVVLALRDIYQPPRYEHDFDTMTPNDFHRVVVAAPPALTRWLPRGLRKGPVKEAVSFVGYLYPRLPMRVADRQADEIRILCQTGGGRDGRALLETVMSAVDVFALTSPRPVRLRMSTGPLMCPSEADALRSMAGETTEVHTWWDPPSFDGRQAWSRPDLAISMAGYNSCVEAATDDIPTVLVPRFDPGDREQEIRACLFSDWFPHLRTVEPGKGLELAVALTDLLHGDLRPRARHSAAPDDMFARAEAVSAAVVGSSA